MLPAEEHARETGDILPLRSATEVRMQVAVKLGHQVRPGLATNCAS